MLTIDPRAALDHRRQGGPAGVERGRQVGPDHGVPVGRLDLEERPDLGEARVVHEAVDAPEPGDDRMDERLGRRAVRDVGRERPRRPSPRPGLAGASAPRRPPARW